MIRYATLVGLVLGLLSPAAAQERHASVRLEDGRLLEGRVLSMDLKQLVIRVGDKVLLVPATEISNCRFHTGPAGAAAGDPAQAAQDPAAAPQEPAPAPAGEVAPVPEPSGDVVPVAGEQPAPEAEAADASDRVTWDGPLPDPAPTADDVRRSGYAPYWDERIDRLDSRYPWMSPAAPTQWISIGLLLLLSSGFLVHLSVRVAGGERIQMERSVSLGVWYILSGLGQFAMVPVNDLSVTLMLLGNATIALFLLTSMFGLTRWGALVALVVQLGFLAVGVGILELVSSLLVTVGVTQ